MAPSLSALLSLYNSALTQEEFRFFFLNSNGTSGVLVSNFSVTPLNWALIRWCIGALPVAFSHIYCRISLRRYSWRSLDDRIRFFVGFNPNSLHRGGSRRLIYRGLQTEVDQNKTHSVTLNLLLQSIRK